MENIEEIFKEKNFDKETLSLLNNFIEEFDSLFGKYVSREEMIKRINENLDYSVIFTKFEDPSFLGTYESEARKISLLDTLSEEKKKSVFFHEMIHCITTFKGKTGFYKKDFIDDFVDFIDWDSELIDDAEEPSQNSEFSKPRVEEIPVYGLTEGFAQLASKIRDEKYGVYINSYPILTEQTENLAEFLGRDNFFAVAFNSPDKLDRLMIEQGLFYSLNDYSEFANNFNILWKKENELYRERVFRQTPEGRLFHGIFGNIFNQIDNTLKRASVDIISTYLTKYAERNDFPRMFDIIRKCEKQLVLDPEYATYFVVFERIQQLMNEEEIPEEDVLDMIPEEHRELVEDELRFRKFLELSPQEALEKVIDPKENVYDNIILGLFEEEYRVDLTRHILGHRMPKKFASSISFHLFDHLGEYIKSNGLNPETISFEEVEFPRLVGKVFNMYKATGDKTDYLATFSTVLEGGEFEELRVVEDKETVEMVRKGLAEYGKEDVENAVVFSTKEGIMLCYLGDDEYICIDDERHVHESSDVKYYKSEAEEVGDRLKRVATRYINLSGVNAPTVIMLENSKRLRNLESKIREYRGEAKFTPEDIEKATTEISLEDVKKMLEEFAVVQNTREESFEKGIGYDGE